MKCLIALILIVFCSCNERKNFYNYSVTGDQFRLPIKFPFELVSNLNMYSWYLNLDSSINGTRQFIIDSISFQGDTLFLLTDKICYSAQSGKIWLVIVSNRQTYILSEIVNLNNTVYSVNDIYLTYKKILVYCRKK